MLNNRGCGESIKKKNNIVFGKPPSYPYKAKHKINNLFI